MYQGWADLNAGEQAQKRFRKRVQVRVGGCHRFDYLPDVHGRGACCSTDALHVRNRIRRTVCVAADSLARQTDPVLRGAHGAQCGAHHHPGSRGCADDILGYMVRHGPAGQEGTSVGGVGMRRIERLRDAGFVVGDGNHGAGQADRNAEAMNGVRLAAATAEREGLQQHVNREDVSGESSEHELHRAAARNSHHDLTAKACKAQRRLASLGFSGHIDIVGDRNQLSHKQVKAVSRLLDELSNNIARHGKPGEYLFRVGLGNGSFGILASNLCKDEQELSGESRGVGLRLITRTVEQLGGDIQTNTDDGEWTIAIRVSTDEDA